MKKKIKLKWKIARYLCVFGILLIAVIWIFQIVLLQPMYEQNKVHTIRSAADQIVAALGTDSLNETIYSVSAQNDTCVRIINANADAQSGSMGCVLYRISNQEIIEQVVLADTNGGSYLSKQHFEGIQMPGQEELKSITLTRIVDNEDGRNIVMVYSGISPVNATTQTLSMQLMYICGFVILALALLTWLLNRTISNPLTSINEEAKKLPGGEFTANDQNNAYLEIQELNQTLSSAAEEIRKADKAKRDLIANVSHDLRTPLTMISGYGEMMQDLPGEKTDENLQVIINESQRLNALVNDLLDLSKYQEHRIELVKQPFNLSERIETELQKYEVYRQRDGYQIDTSVEANLSVNADEQRIAQVFNNFMTNAINYSGSKKQIQVRLTKVDSSARLEVQDFGEGIAKEQIHAIWDRYYKIDREHVRVSNGSGIGLSICHEILELHGIPYGVNSEVGKGSTFWFSLPLIQSDEKTKETV